ncbi:pyridoxamine 5'-phosphate oxidase [Mycobacterium paragordonae]|nr:pyridoxamine 5'-phosphate oxidase [Mycobacterium paragordonae]
MPVRPSRLHLQRLIDVRRSRDHFDALARALGRRKFATIATLGKNGRPHATEVIYAMSEPGEPVCFYVTTRTGTRKVRNIRACPDVAFVVPLARISAPWFPPRAAQFQGTAEIVDGQEEGALRAFNSSWFLRRILSTERRIVSLSGELCFIRIRPDPVIFTYGVGMSVWKTLRRPKEAAGRVAIPADRLFEQ